jgi:hypothetical protein
LWKEDRCWTEERGLGFTPTTGADMETLFAILLGIGAIWLLTQPLFWIIALFLAGLASCFAMLASIIHFEIFGAVGFFLLMAPLWGVPILIAAHKEDERRWNARHRARVS